MTAFHWIVIVIAVLGWAWLIGFLCLMVKAVRADLQIRQWESDLHRDLMLDVDVPDSPEGLDRYL